jgi:lipid-binding SYLF domain-containing protein
LSIRAATEYHEMRIRGSRRTLRRRRQRQIKIGGKIMQTFRTILSLACALGLFAMGGANAASKEEIDAEVRQAVEAFYKHTSAGKELAQKASGMLVFPSVIKAGIGIGGEYGEGSLLIKGKPAAYYNTAAASIGFQLGAQARTQVVLFMNEHVLTSFRNSKGWQAGVDGSVALATLGAGGAIDTQTIKEPIIGFIFSNKGLMYNLTFEGSKITKLDK